MQQSNKGDKKQAKLKVDTKERKIAFGLMMVILVFGLGIIAVGGTRIGTYNSGKNLYSVPVMFLFYVFTAAS